MTSFPPFLQYERYLIIVITFYHYYGSVETRMNRGITPEP